MPLPATPAKVTDSPFSSMRGHHVAIRYPDFEAARSFWVDTMGWRLLHSWPYGSLILAYMMPPNQDDFFLQVISGPGASPQIFYPGVDASLAVSGFNHVSLSVDNVDETTAELRGRGVEILNAPFEMEEVDARLAYFRDPWGNMFGLYERASVEAAH